MKTNSHTVWVQAVVHMPAHAVPDVVMPPLLPFLVSGPLFVQTFTKDHVIPQMEGATDTFNLKGGGKEADGLDGVLSASQALYEVSPCEFSFNSQIYIHLLPRAPEKQPKHPCNFSSRMPTGDIFKLVRRAVLTLLLSRPPSQNILPYI